MGINFDGVNPESKAKLEGMLKDGKITKEEMQGLTAAEKEALAKAFGGELPPIGDNFITPAKVEAKSENEEKPGPLKRVGKWLTETTAGKITAGVVGTTAVVAGAVATFGTGIAAVVALLGLGLTATSCAKDENIDLTININIDIKTADMSDIYTDYYVKMGKSLEDIAKLLEENNRNTKELLDYVISIGHNLGDIFTLLSSIKLGQDEQTNYIKKLVNGNEEAGMYLEAILNAVRDGNKISEGNQVLLNDILNEIGDLKGGQEGVQESLNKLLALVKESITTNKEIGENTHELINKVLEKIGDIKIEGGKTDGDNTKVLAALDKITELLEKSIKQDKDIGDKQQELLTQLIDLVSKIGTKLDVDLSKLIVGVDKGNIKLDEIKTLIAELTKLVNEGNENNKVLGDKILKYLEKFGYDMNTNFSAVLNAINNITASGGDTSAIEALLEKVLDNQDKNTKAIIEAMGKIKLEAGDVTIDLSKIEDMMKELLKQTRANGDKLDSLNLTMDTLKALIKTKFDKDDERYNNIENLLNVIISKLGSKGDSEISAKLDAILAKLEDILQAIKDHKVTVDITGKVTCECNCGQNHEGIIGDLNSLMG